MQFKTMLKSKGLTFKNLFLLLLILMLWWLLLGLFCLVKFKLYQMKVKSAFLNRYLKVEVNHDVSNDVNNMEGVIVKDNGIPMIVQIYVDDIMFWRMSNKMLDLFFQQMQVEFEMEMVGELTYFLGFQVKQFKDGIFVS